jgi:hypothetical protein
MAVRKPLVNINGVAAELPVGDQLGGLAPATVPGQAATFDQLSGGKQFYSGSDYSIATNSSATGTQAQLANLIRAYPWRIREAVSFNTIRLEVTTLLAGGRFRLGLYTSNALGVPNALIANSDAGEYTADTTGVKFFNLASNIVVDPGLVYLSILASGALTVRAVALGAVDTILGTATNAASNTAFTAWSASQTYGPMPATFTAGATKIVQHAPPYVTLRVA